MVLGVCRWCVLCVGVCCVDGAYCMLVCVVCWYVLYVLVLCVGVCVSDVC